MLCCHVVLEAALEPEQLHGATLRAQALVADKVAALSGVVAQTLPDAVVAYFGHPQALQRAEECACGAGLGVLEALPGLNAELSRSLGLPPGAVRLRIGIQAGSAVVDSVGKGSQSLRLALGQVPNDANALQAAAALNQVLVGEAVREAAASRFQLAPAEGVAPLRSRGMSGRVWRLVAHIDAPVLVCDEGAAAGTGAADSSAAVLLGRGEEVAHLLSLARLAQQGNGQLCLVTAGAGWGKSALVAHVVARLRDEPTASNGEKRVVVLVAQSSAVLRECEPLHTACQWLRRWQHRDMDTTAVVARIVKDLAEPRLQDDKRLSSALRALLGDAAAQAPLADRVEVLALVLGTLARSRQVVLVVEDSESIDAASVSVVDALVREQLRGARLLVLLGIRTSDAGLGDDTMIGWLREPCCHQLELRPLHEEAARELIAAISEGGVLGEDVVRYVLSNCGTPESADHAARAGVMHAYCICDKTDGKAMKLILFWLLVSCLE